jgi:Skp family chaperone for outer membrane proteins
VRHCRKLSAVCGLLVASVVSSGVAHAQAPAKPASAGTKIAIVDVARILKDHPGIKSQMQQIEQELKNFDASFKAKNEELKNEVAVLKDLVPGSPDYTKQEEKIAQIESRGKLDFGRRRKELIDAEAKVFHDNYQTISRIVGSIAVANNIGIVFRYNSEEMDLEDKDSLIRGVMKNIVYHDAGLDMTPVVMEMLNQHFARTAAAAGQPARR